MLTDETRRLLHKAKWKEGAQIDIGRFRDRLLTAGYKISPAVENFLSRFGGIKVVIPHPKVAGSKSTFHFNAAVAVERVFKSTVDEYSTHAGEELCVVGEAENGYLTLMVGPSGKMYAGQDDFLYLVGNDAEASIERLCSHEDFEPIEVES